jgi:hypothetical protein
MDSFYVVLPSNTPFPGNKTSDYLVKLPNIIDLSDGNWSVALSSITYPLSFSGVDEEQFIHIYYANDKISKINIPKRLQYSTVKQFESVINDAILSSLFDETKVTVKPRTTRATDSKPRPPLKETQPKDQRPLPQAKSTSEPPPVVQKPRPPLKQPPKETSPSIESTQPIEPATALAESQLKEPQPSESSSQKEIEQPSRPSPPKITDTTPPVQDLKPTPPPKVLTTAEPATTTEKTTPPTKITEKTPEPPVQDLKPRPTPKVLTTPEPSTTSTEKTRPPTRDVTAEKTVSVIEPTKKPEGQVQLTEKELQSLETAKRVSNQLIKDLEEKYEEIEQFVNDAFGLYDITNETHIPDEAIKAKTIKTQIIEQTNPLISLKSWFIRELNKAKDLNLNTIIEYSKQNVKGAKITTDQIKLIKQKIIIGKEDDPSLFHQIENRYNKVVELYEEFAKLRGLPSANLNTVYYEAKGYFDKAKNAYDKFTNIADELFSYMGELQKYKEKIPDLILLINPIVAMRSFGNAKYDELEILKYQLENYFITRNLEEEQKILLKMKEIKRFFISDDGNTGYLPDSKKMRDNFLAGYNKFKNLQALKNAESANKIQISSNEKADSWNISKETKEQDRLFGEESHLEGHIPKIDPLKEKVDKDTTDSWNIIAADGKELLDYRKEEIINKIKELLEKGVELGGFKGIKRSAYQQIYFYYDSDQLQRFYLWASPDTLFNINKVKISRQLAYMLGFVTDDEGFIQLNSFGKYSPDISGGLHSFYIYSPNLIANTIIGNQYGPLLRVVNVDLETKNKVVETIYTQEFHHKVILKQIPEINIKILSDSGRPIEFNWGNCIITLHFKRALF